MEPFLTKTESAHEPELAPAQVLKHAALFLLTFLTTTIAGMLWQGVTDLEDFHLGLPYSISILFILSCHEFGHYFAARHHGVRTTLPYYIPIPPLPMFINFGTLGAVIRTKQVIPHRAALFDIGIAGPIAGFVASVIVLAIGFMSLPGPEFLLAIHPDYDFSTGMSATAEPGFVLTFGSSLLYTAFEWLFSPAGAYVPPMSEMYHYPLLVTGWFGLLVTALNMLPAGQLDGGHVTYAMFGDRQHLVGKITVGLLLLFGGIGILPALMDLAGAYEQAVIVMEMIPSFGAIFWPGWLFWALLIFVVIKVKHPEVHDFAGLGSRRRMLGWFSYAMFAVSLIPSPIYMQ
ncbi:MAG: site-2 protease family protein [Bacteroidota bacterium]|jgi:membrane-associated protease RseP (regulator of RpoE activity)|nr:site-2 protease family protein [Bacteroidota bacterium]